MVIIFIVIGVLVMEVVGGLVSSILGFIMLKLRKCYVGLGLCF